jgi:lipopolysaccharide transport protein LptA
MANSSPSRLERRFAAALACGLLGAAAVAQVPREAQKIVMDAVPVEIDTRNNTAVFRDVVITQGDLRIQANEAHVAGGLDFETGKWTVIGDVRINAEGGSLKSDKAVVSFRDKLISQATITGSPAVFEQKRQDGTLSHGRAGTIDYETASGTVNFAGDAWLSIGGNEISGQSFAYNIKTQKMQPLTRGDAARSDTSRIRFVIPPSSAKDAKDKNKEKKP